MRSKKSLQFKKIIKVNVVMVNQKSLSIKTYHDINIGQLKQAIQKQNPLLTADQMNLFINGRRLLNTETVSQCEISNYRPFVQKKIGLDEVPGIQTTTKPDCLTFDDSDQARALMPCGHAISQDTLISILQSLIDAKKFEIKCPVKKGEAIMCGYISNEPCDTTWPYELCRQIGVLTSEEKQKFEAGIEESYVLKQMGGKQCPFCRYWIIKGNIADDRVRCPNCASKNKAFDFC